MINHEYGKIIISILRMSICKMIAYEMNHRNFFIKSAYSFILLYKNLTNVSKKLEYCVENVICLLQSLCCTSILDL